MRRIMFRAGTAGLVLSLASPLPCDLAAQGLPAWRPMNPLVSSRSVLGFIPVAPSAPTWTTSLDVDYASVIEASEREGSEVLIDAEIMRAEVRVGRRLGSHAFLQVTTGLRGTYAGFLDPALGWYHRRLGIDQAQRASRPDNTFAYRVILPDGTILTRDRGGTQLGDLRITLGFGHTADWQTVLVAGLPLPNGESDARLETVSAGVLTTLRSAPLDRVLVEGSLGLGAAPPAGELAEHQRWLFFSGTAGGRVRFWGRQSLYLNLLFHSPLYHGTTTPALDGSDVSLDFGFLLRTGERGPELRIGMVEDLYAVGPAVDLVLRLGARW